MGGWVGVCVCVCVCGWVVVCVCVPSVICNFIAGACGTHVLPHATKLWA